MRDTGVHPIGLCPWSAREIDLPTAYCRVYAPDLQVPIWADPQPTQKHWEANQMSRTITQNEAKVNEISLF